MNGEKVCREKGKNLNIFCNFSLKNVESIVFPAAWQRGRKMWGGDSWKHSRKSSWDVELGNCGNIPNWKFSIVIHGNLVFIQSVSYTNMKIKILLTCRQANIHFSKRE